MLKAPGMSKFPRPRRLFTWRDQLRKSTTVPHRSPAVPFDILGTKLHDVRGLQAAWRVFKYLYNQLLVVSCKQLDMLKMCLQIKNSLYLQLLSLLPLLSARIVSLLACSASKTASLALVATHAFWRVSGLREATLRAPKTLLRGSTSSALRGQSRA